MNQVKRAIWYIETHFTQSIELQDIAEASGISRFHLSRLFAQVTGYTVTAYVRGRRLSEAARLLAKGEKDILSVALSYGYGSHEAFTRAFRSLFGVTPDAVKTNRSVCNLDLIEPVKLTINENITLSKPDIREAGPLYLVGLREYKKFSEISTLPHQWRRFADYAGEIENRVGSNRYGIHFVPSSYEEGFDYMSSVSVDTLNNLPEGLSGVRIEKKRFAVFRHSNHVSTIGDTFVEILGNWIPNSDSEIQASPLMMIEHFDASFDPTTGRGDIEIWVPLIH